MQKFKDFQSIQNAEMKDRLAMIQFEQMMDNFDARLEGLVDQVDQTNKGYDKMFTRSLVQSGFRRIGGNFTKDIIVGSTVIDGILRETRNIRAYQYMSYLMPDLRTEAGLTDTPAIKDFTAIQIMLEQALNVIAGEEKAVFGEGQEVLEAGKWRDVEEDETLEDNAITKGTGLFGDWLGYAPVYKSGEDIKMHRGMLANQETYGSGEMGRIYGLMQWYQMQEGEGIAEVNLPGDQIRLWNDEDSWFEAPSVGSLVDIAQNVMINIATGGNAWITGLFTFGTDALDIALDQGSGYITGEQAALQFFQKGVTAAFSIGFDGLMDGVVGSFKGFGILAEGLENLGKSIIKNNFNSWVNAFELDGKGGWDWNGEAYQESAWGSGALGMYASAFVTPMAQRGATDFFSQDGTGLDLTGNVFGIKNLAALGNTIGGLTGEFASYLFDGEFSVNVLNMSDFTGGAVNQGLFELSLTGKSRLGGGGANVGGLTGILNSLEAIKTDALYVASRKLGGNQGLAEINATNRLGYAGEADLAKRLVGGDLRIQWSDLDNAHGKFVQGENGQIHISTAYANNDAESAAKMAAVIGHEATHEQGERIEAYAHLSGSSIYRTLMQQGRATDSDFLNGIMNELMREENYLENSGDTDWWKYRMNSAGDIIGAFESGKATEAIMNDLFGEGNWSDEDIAALRKYMIENGMIVGGRYSDEVFGSGLNFTTLMDGIEDGALGDKRIDLDNISPEILIAMFSNLEANDPLVKELWRYAEQVPDQVLVDILGDNIRQGGIEFLKNIDADTTEEQLIALANNQIQSMQSGLAHSIGMMLDPEKQAGQDMLMARSIGLVRDFAMAHMNALPGLGDEAEFEIRKARGEFGPNPFYSIEDWRKDGGGTVMTFAELGITKENFDLYENRLKDIPGIHRLVVAPSDQIPDSEIQKMRNQNQRTAALFFNAYGNFVNELGKISGIPAEKWASVLTLESGGGTRVSEDRPVIRVEINQIWFNETSSKSDQDWFKNHFYFARLYPNVAGEAELGHHKLHKYRTNTEEEMTLLHGSQEREYEVLNFLQSRYTQEQILKNTSIGTAQIMGWSATTLGYESATEMIMRLAVNLIKIGLRIIFILQDYTQMSLEKQN
jgi:hypothetical protein